jgi:thiamine transport system permease protein
MIIMLGEKGIVNQFMGFILGTEKPVLDVLYSMTAVVLTHVVYYLPLAMLILEQGFSTVDQDRLDAAHVAGAGWLMTLRTVYLGHLIPFLAASAILVFAFSFITYSTPILIGGKFTTLEVEIYSTRTRSISSSLAIIQLVMTLVISLLVIVLRERTYGSSQAPTRPLRQEAVGSQSLGMKALMIYCVLIAAVELMPVYLVLAQSVSSSAVILLPTSVSFDNFLALPAVEFGFGVSFADVLLVSLAIAFVASLCSVLLSVLIAWTGLGSRRARESTGILLSLPLSISRSSLALGMMLSYGVGMLQLYGSWVLIVLGDIALIVPLIFRVIEASWLRIGSEVREAASLSGAGDLYRLMRIELPLIAPAIASSFMLALSSSISEFTFASFFSTLNLMTLPISVATMLDLRRFGLAASLNAVIVLIVVAAEVLSAAISEEALSVM